MLRKAGQNAMAKLAGSQGKQGFTFAEVMVALLIMVLLATFVATAIPVAFTTYREVVGDTNAQVALSTTASALRDELGLAVGVKTDGTTVLYQTGEGTWAKIENGDKGLVKYEYAQGVKEGAVGPDFTKPLNGGKAIDLIPATMIVGASGGDDLRVQLLADSSGAYITYENGVFTVHGIQVLMGEGETPVESIDDYKVKAVFDPAP